MIGRAGRHRYAAITTALLTMVGFSCTTPLPPPAPAPHAEWVDSSASHPAQVELHGYSWKEIAPGLTSRSEIEKRFKPVKLGNPAEYEIDRIKTTITYDASNKVTSIRLPPKAALSQQALIERFGNPDDSTNLPSGGKQLRYEHAGVAVEYPATSDAPSAIELLMPIKAPEAIQAGIAEALAPIRPPLTDLPRRRQVVEEALNEDPNGFSWVSLSRERNQAIAVYDEFQSNNTLMPASDLQDYADGLIKRLSSVIPETPCEWKVVFIKGQLPNAMNAGGCYIFPTQGLLEQYDTEAELAYVMAHEMAHQLKGHLASAQTRQDIAKALILTAEVATQVMTGVSGAVSSAGNLMTQVATAPFDRAQELEADRIALDIVSAAGYDPRLALSTMERLRTIQQTYQNEPTIASNHPQLDVREEAIRGWLEAHSGQDYASALITTQEFIAVRARYRLNPW